MKAVPIVQEVGTEDGRKQKRLSKYSGGTSITFGGHLPPRLDIPYTITVKDKKDQYHAICMMKVSTLHRHLPPPLVSSSQRELEVRLK